ncbi:hypothetical protein PAXINDRAFT_168743 [Paxillus involutus ATCC 200175]|nr:hypothetical protein PAXINDRAFT_168743 [Paxillus involutus ATCC 200175]
MLVVDSNSTCDVCLECYTSGANVPHAIACGHVFCQKCLEHLMQHKCPLCRTRFSPRDVRKLHVDRDPTARAIESASEPVAEGPRLDDGSQRLLDDIGRIVKEGGKLNEIRRVIDECRTYYKLQPGNQYTPVRVSCLLLNGLAEAHGKLHLQADQLREVTIARDEIHDRLTSELEAIDFKYQELQRTSRDEKDTALAIEKSLREHYDHMNNFWKGQLDSANRECQSLREELDRFRSTQTTFALPRPVELQCFYKTDTKRSYPSIGELSKVENPKGRLLDDDLDFHLSPLGEVAAPLASTVPSLLALGDDSDEEALTKPKRKEVPIREEPEPELEEPTPVMPIAYPFPAPRPDKADPIAIPSRTSLSRQASSMAMSVGADYWSSGISSSKPRDDVVMSSRPASPVRRYSADHSILPYGPRAKDSYTREMAELKRRDSNEMASKDQMATWQILSSGISKLHDLLDSPRPPSSLQGPMLHRSEFPEPSLTRPTSRLTTPSRPSSTAQLPSTSSTSLVQRTDDPHSIPTERKPLVRASDVAMQLEKERLDKLEKERRRLRETSILSSSLKDTTNAPADSFYLHRHKSHGVGKMREVYPAPAETYA